MEEYRQMYLRLFNEVSDAISLLIKAQQESEELFLSYWEEQVKVISCPDPEVKSHGR